jgi:hypothetical protein
MAFLARSGHINRFQIVARRGKRAIYIDKVDPLTTSKELSDFAIERQ